MSDHALTRHMDLRQLSFIKRRNGLIDQKVQSAGSCIASSSDSSRAIFSHRRETTDDSEYDVEENDDEEEGLEYGDDDHAGEWEDEEEVCKDTGKRETMTESQRRAERLRLLPSLIDSEQAVILQASIVLDQCDAYAAAFMAEPDSRSPGSRLIPTDSIGLDAARPSSVPAWYLGDVSGAQILKLQTSPKSLSNGDAGNRSFGYRPWKQGRPKAREEREGKEEHGTKWEEGELAGRLVDMGPGSGAHVEASRTLLVACEL
ncbi:unnamed protein product [Protopolystoma xenopodis]|uniref:Uncharacterized protein n=1 Tax=Protopolystoma xenopodis TaxID=117903 RepID=A0A3S5FH45_9PLAT|nr:unnamed protein product [Protopolystoma xenopodis]